MTEQERRNTVILVNEQDQQVGTEEKLRAHQLGLLHRAFSIFIFNNKGEFLLQQRALTKYHAGGLWSNTCCGHPMPHETIEQAIHRRLQEEMGFDCELTKNTELIYNTPVTNNLIEHEYLHVWQGIHTEGFVVNPEEVMAFRWISKEELQQEFVDHPEQFTPWFKIVMTKISFS